MNCRCDVSAFDLRKSMRRLSKIDDRCVDFRRSMCCPSKIDVTMCRPSEIDVRGVGTGGATGARAPLVLQQAKLTYKAYVGLSLRDPVGSADHMAQGVRDAIGIATQYSYIIVRHYLEL